MSFLTYDKSRRNNFDGLLYSVKDLAISRNFNHLSYFCESFMIKKDVLFCCNEEKVVDGGKKEQT